MKIIIIITMVVRDLFNSLFLAIICANLMPNGRNLKILKSNLTSNCHQSLESFRSGQGKF